jgi:hypothetical protein
LPIVGGTLIRTDPEITAEVRQVYLAAARERAQR